MVVLMSSLSLLYLRHPQMRQVPICLPQRVNSLVGRLVPHVKFELLTFASPIMLDRVLTTFGHRRQATMNSKKSYSWNSAWRASAVLERQHFDLVCSSDNILLLLLQIMHFIWLLLVLITIFPVCVCSNSNVVVISVDTKHALRTVEENYVGVTFDSSQFANHWRHVNFTSVD